MSSPIAPPEPAHRAPLQVALAVASAIVVAVGVVGFGWPVFLVILVYWIENVCIGVANVVRLLVAGGRGGFGALLGALFLVVFFCVHYGLFTFVHGVFVFAMFAPPTVEVPTNPLEFLLTFFDLIADDPWILVAIAVTAFAVAADTRRWIRETRAANTTAGGASGDHDDLKRLMMAPYGRVVVLHLTLILGGLFAKVLNAPALAAILFVALKLAFDLVRLHAPALATLREGFARRSRRAR